jgi:signal transduction histidine kinase
MELTFNPLPADISELWIDRSMIRRILVNLVDNAIKYTPYQGQVSLTTTLKGDTLHFAIKDNGPGISKSNQARIFNKFSRVDHSANAPSGVGLGLAFCKLAAEAHGGSMAVESEGIPGQGSTFYLTIPIISPPEE